jgi:hypothetical protein
LQYAGDLRRLPADGKKVSNPPAYGRFLKLALGWQPGYLQLEKHGEIEQNWSKQQYFD